MKKIQPLLIITALFFGINACKTLAPVSDIDEIVELDTIEVDANRALDIYRASEKRVNDLLHTKLEVSFDWDSAFLFGKANLSFSPYFYPTDTLVLDAKGFQIHTVALVDQIGKQSPLNYTYDSLFLKIKLDKTYKRSDTFEVFIDYTAMPNKLKEGGSAAITSDKGLYFINNDGSDPNKPKQIWTQGETEASSCWFPTIDAPNEKTTQEIYITVDSVYETLSNGALIFQTENEGGSRTDYWKQELPHAPYLFMMAIGDFAIVKDEWNGIPVNYYVEHKYKAFAKDIYPNTPEMLTFFSEKLGYDYPWDKYHQIVVRDYVSGAMENTGAVIYGEFAQGNDRFLIDNSAEDVVAHELFHHWFGDLVTCESWSNLPLNESFATYGEYLWNEYKYGKDEADRGGYNDQRIYLQQSRVNKKKLIRFQYDNKEDMFDTHSYQKGGRILHMLRKYVGDDAFFAALNLYLTENEYTSVEIHQLRLAFEKITGEDLNWFFNQWFLGAGHPIIEVEQEYIDSTKMLAVTIKQSQKGEGIADIFELPTTIGIVDAQGKLHRKEIRLVERNQTFTYPMNEAPLLINLDVDKILLAEIEQSIDKKDASLLYRVATNFVDKLAAIKLMKNLKDSVAHDAIEMALNDPFWSIRRLAIRNSKNFVKARKEKAFQIFTMLAEKDEKSTVRSAAISALAKYFKEDLSPDLLKKSINDRSYRVVSASLNALYEMNNEEGVSVAEGLEKEDNSTLKTSIASIYAKEGDPKRQAFFETTAKNATGFNKYPILISYSDFITKQNDEFIETHLSFLKEQSTGKDNWFLRMAAVNGIISLKSKYTDELESIDKQINNEDDPAQKSSLQEKKTNASKMMAKVKDTLTEIYEAESNKNLKSMIEVELK